MTTACNDKDVVPSTQLSREEEEKDENLPPVVSQEEVGPLPKRRRSMRDHNVSSD